MSYTTCRDGLHDVVETVSGIKDVLDYEPDMIQTGPLAWILLDSYERTHAAAGITAMRYRLMVRIATNVQNSKAAEDELIATALSVADAVDNNPQFSGAITSGLATSEDGRAGWIIAGGVKCRVVDVFVSALDKYAY